MSVFYNLSGTKNKELSSNKVITKILKYSDIKNHYQNGDFIIPDFQRDLDNDKINDLVNEINEDNNYFLTRTNPIQLACNLIGDRKCKYYIIDGQHRIQAILKLADKYPDNRQIIVATMCDDEISVMEIFKKLIKEKNDQYLLNTTNLNKDFSASREYKLRQLLRRDFPHHFIQSEKNPYIYSIEGFLRALSEEKLFEVTRINQGEKILCGIFKKLKKFTNKVEYKKMIKEKPNRFYKLELEYIIKCDFLPLGLKNNNFIKYLCTNRNMKIVPYHNYTKNSTSDKTMKKKDKIRKVVKEDKKKVD